MHQFFKQLEILSSEVQGPDFDLCQLCIPQDHELNQGVAATARLPLILTSLMCSTAFVRTGSSNASPLIVFSNTWTGSCLQHMPEVSLITYRPVNLFPSKHPGC